MLAAEDATGSFAAAGTVVGGFSAGVALFAPLRGRLVDRRGSGRALPPLAAVSGAALLAVALLCGLRDAPVVLLTALAFVAGASTPPLVASMRLEWQRLLGPGSPALARAYAFESSLQTAVFVVGPLLAGAGIALGGARVTLALSALLLVVGTVGFAAIAAEPGHGDAAGPARSPMRMPGVRVLVAVTIVADVALGAVEVAVAAFASDRGEPGSAGVLLACFALGGVIGGLLYGARTWRGTPALQLAAVTATGAVVLAPLALVETAAVLAGLLLLAGAPSAAQWATASLALDHASGGRAGAEAYTWLSAANSVGIAVGSVVGGVLIESRGTATTFAAASATMALAAVLVLVARGSLTGGVRARAATP